MKFDPFGQWSKAFEAWQKMADDSLARANLFYSELEKAGTKNVGQVETAIDELAKLQKETLEYNAKLGAEVRKFSLEAFQHATSVFASQASA